MIWGGAALIVRFDWLLYVFGALSGGSSPPRTAWLGGAVLFSVLRGRRAVAMGVREELP